MQSLSRSGGGKSAIQAMRTDPAVFGGDTSHVVSTDPNVMGGNAKVIWDQGVSKANPSSDPDLFAPPDYAFSGISAGELVAMNPKAQGRYFNWVMADAKRAQGAAELVNKAVGSPNMVTRLGEDSYANMRTFAAGSGKGYLSADAVRRIG
jgi:hypothetical protein